MNWILAGCVSGFLGVAMGAFGAHAVSGKISEKAFGIYQTAAQYQMYHSLALIALGLWAREGAANSAGWCFLLGILIFSGSLYALALTDVRVLGAITPIGGVLFLAGWALFAHSSWSAYGK